VSIQIYPISKTYGFVVSAIKDIMADEEITIMYERTGYYGGECRCKSCTKKDPRDLSVLKPGYQGQEAEEARDEPLDEPAELST
jgi:hypothetical protein